MTKEIDPESTTLMKEKKQPENHSNEHTDRDRADGSRGVAKRESCDRRGNERDPGGPPEQLATDSKRCSKAQIGDQAENYCKRAGVFQMHAFDPEGATGSGSRYDAMRMRVNTI